MGSADDDLHQSLRMAVLRQPEFLWTSSPKDYPFSNSFSDSNFNLDWQGDWPGLMLFLQI